jgi:hypothetical protein
VNNMPAGSSNYFYDQGYGGPSAGITWTWNTDYNHVLHGTHYCATNEGSGNYNSPVKGQSPSGSNGKYCYCKLLDVNGNSCVGSWVYHMGRSDASNCSNNCAYACVYHVHSNFAFRAAVVSPNLDYKVFDASSCPTNYTAIPSDVGTVAENDVTCANGTCNISCSWQ